MVYCDQYHQVSYSLETIASGYSTDFYISSSTSNNIKADIPVLYLYHIKIWGQLRSHKDLLLSGLTVKLLKINPDAPSPHPLEVGKVLTDDNGVYFFDLPDQTPTYYQLITQSDNPFNNKILISNLNPYD
ncbi:MAG: hypothetical protein RR324_02355 [Cellulosilyticaceae bacterium]